MFKLSAPRGQSHYSTLQNNTTSWWFRDAGMRKLAIAIAVGFAGSINGGYDGSLMNGLLSNPRFVQAIDNPNGNKLGLISAAYSLGGLVGNFPAPLVCDRFGRRCCILVGITIVITGAMVQTFTIGGNKMLGGRLIVGFGGAFQNIGGGPLVAEVSHPRNRPQTTALINTCWFFGAIIAAWVTFGALDIPSNWSWRLCCLIQAVPCLIQLVGLWFAEESPRWLISKGREADGLRVLAKYHANGDDQDELVQFEFQEIKEAIAAEQQANATVSVLTLTKTRGNRHRLLIITCCAFFSQWVGNGIISYYLAKILTSVGITEPTAQAGFNGGLQIFNWLMAIAGSLASERVGRRPLWLTSAIGMLGSFAIITACSAVYAKTGTVAAGRAVMAFLFIYNGFYDIAFSGLSLAYPLEILPFALRAQGIALQNFLVSAASFFNQYANPVALDALAWKYYFVYIGVISIAIGCIYFFYPETQGRTLEEVAEIFDGPGALPHVAQVLEAESLEDDIEEKGVKDRIEAVNQV